ncbi:MAG: polysaccharide biosynthesis C-terminal domain-containing protein, partial [Bacteroidota bacterium]|nr:polysaccharide biosynthesis C-terminal domain-containing protein [Bacteroidota bacterium]MDX5429515.1 polysaccharide biosynthesis C-terminal domain-containing protein [Bacteroidota bacterium]MDX5468300.1 polysaccharide biosynthesis C-terminal domain-containing protein [Bacteroidota bacterium]
MALGYIFGTLLTAKSELKLLNYISVCGLVLNVVLNAILIPKYQAIGAVYATIATQSLVTLASIWFCLKYFSIALYDLLNLRVISYVLVNIALSYGLSRVLDSSILAILLSVGLGLFLVPYFHIIRIGELLRLLKSERQSS